MNEPTLPKSGSKFSELTVVCAIGAVCLLMGYVALQVEAQRTEAEPEQLAGPRQTVNKAEQAWIEYAATRTIPAARLTTLKTSARARHVSQAAVQEQPASQPVAPDVPEGYVYPPNSENGNVMTYEHD